MNVAAQPAPSFNRDVPPRRTKNLDLPRGHVRRSGGVVRKVSLYLPPDLAKRFQIRCFEVERDMSEVIADIITAWLDQPSAPKPKVKRPT